MLLRWIHVAVCISSSECLSLFKNFKPLPPAHPSPLSPLPQEPPGSRTVMTDPWGSSGLSGAVSQALVAVLSPFRCHLCGTSSFCRKLSCWSVSCCFFLQSFYEPGLQPWGRWISSKKAVVSQTGGSVTECTGGLRE